MPGRPSKKKNAAVFSPIVRAAVKMKKQQAVWLQCAQDDGDHDPTNCPSCLQNTSAEDREGGGGEEEEETMKSGPDKPGSLVVVPSGGSLTQVCNNCSRSHFFLNPPDVCKCTNCGQWLSTTELLDYP
jgi:hypothetical protein